MIRPTQIDRTRTADERAVKVYQARVCGQTFKAISSEYGISTTWARELCERGRNVLELRNNGNPYSELSTRVRNMLVTYECGTTPIEISQWFSTQSERQISTMVTFGVVSRDELNAWLLRHGQKPIKGV
jgi:hypothetical protein